MSLSDRMKQYEAVSDIKLMPKTPMIIRVDGKAFHTWTKGLEKPFDSRFYAAMAATAKYLVNNIQGATLAYGQSDEISIFLRDYENFESQAWFTGRVQKIVSVTASMATWFFNNTAPKVKIYKDNPAFFDARVFILPPHEVVNYFIWRQKDFQRNSVSSVARFYLGNKFCHGLKVEELKEALKNLDTPVDWMQDYESIYKNGYCYFRDADEISDEIPDFSILKEYITVHV